MNNYFDIENQIRLVHNQMDGAITGPMARWQRKRLETSTSSINNSLNASLHLNCPIESINMSSNISTNNIILNSNKTPSNTPNKRQTPTRSTPGCVVKATNSSNKTKTPKTPCNGADRFIPNRSAMNVDISHYLVLNLRLN